MHSNLYLDFLILSDRKQGSINNYASHISSSALALFVVIALQHANGHALTISDAMSLKRMGSSATLHKRIDDLREANMICVTFKNKNRRTKYLSPSEKGDRYLKFMGQLIRTAYKLKT